MFSDILKSNKIVSNSQHFEDRSGFDMSGGGGRGCHNGTNFLFIYFKF